MLDDVKKTYEILAGRYSKYKNLCNSMIIEHYYYMSGVMALNNNKKSDARKKFIDVLRKRPFFLKAWVRLIQTF